MIINQVAAGGGGEKVLKTEIFTASGTWTCPSGVEKAFVRIFGGGGGGSTKGAGGGGGYMAYSELDVTPGTAYPVTIGAGGSSGSAGGVTSFGTLLSANGGTAASNYNGGSGGTGGGGGVGLALDNGVVVAVEHIAARIHLGVAPGSSCLLYVVLERL